tara:strand:+ start:549 stop:740 length:192 start_codon:yes stop_codon:yes gene_type:complete
MESIYIVGLIVCIVIIALIIFVVYNGSKDKDKDAQSSDITSGTTVKVNVDIKRRVSGDIDILQ